MASKGIAVIGGGVVGLLCARYLREAGEPSVVFDKQRVGGEASWAGGGILSPLYPARYPKPLLDLTQYSLSEYPRLASSLSEQTGVDPEWQRSGLIILDPDRNGPENEGNIARVWGNNFSFISAPLLAEMEPNLRRGAIGALFLQEVGQIRSPRLMVALRKEAFSRQNGSIIEYSEIVGFDTTGNKLRSIRTRSGSVEVERCIVAAGAWSGDLLRTAGIVIPVRPVRGQMLLIKSDPGYLRHIVVRNYRYLIPRRDGRILAGSTLEETGFDKSTTAEAKKELYEMASDLVPGLANYPIEAHWAGLRPGSPDFLPFIGEHPKVKGLFVCTGHYRNGFAIAPATARIVVDLVLGRAPTFNPAPFRLDRPVSDEVRPSAL